MRNDLVLRNREAVAQTIEALNAKVFAQQAQINGLQNTLGTLFERIAALEASLLHMRVLLVSKGPSCIR